MTTKPARKLTLRDLLSHLSFLQACKLLGRNGKHLIQAGSKLGIDSEESIQRTPDRLQVRFSGLPGVPATIAAVALHPDYSNRLQWSCSACTGPCEHVGGLFSIVLENKSSLDLAAAPPERAPAASLNEADLVQLALGEREERAKKERMKVKSANAETPWTDYTVTSGLSGKSYRVSMRGLEPGESYCSCPDFRTNTLGTCKHVIKVTSYLHKKFSRGELRRPYKRKRLAVHLRYDGETHLRLLVPDRVSDEVESVIRPLCDKPIDERD